MTVRKGLRSLTSNAANLWASNMLTTATRVVYIIVLARSFGPELYGLLAYAQSWALTLLPLTTLGLGMFLSREVGRAGSDRVAIANRTLGMAIAFTSLTVALGIGAGWFLASGANQTALVVVFSLGLVGRGLSNWCSSMFVACESTRFALSQAIYFRPLEVILGLVVVLLGGDILDVAFVHLISWWAQAAASIHVVHRNIAPLRPTLDWADTRREIRVAGVLGLGLFLSGWLLQSPVVLFKHLSPDSTELGHLALAVQLLAILTMVPLSVGTAAMPLLSRAADRGDTANNEYLRVMLRASILIGSAIALLGMALSPAFIPLIFGASYTPASELVGLTLWLLVPKGISTGAAGILLAHRKDWTLAVSALMGAIAIAATVQVFLTNWGVAGVVLSAALGLTITAGWRLAAALGVERISLWKNLALPLLCVLSAVGTFIFLYNTLPISSLAVSLLVLLGSVLLGGVISPLERSAIFGFTRNLLRSD
jgi:O-antigen/teichoic acid export membrane protein